MQSPFRQKYPIAAFDGGLNSKYEPSVIGENESPDCLNVVYDDLGAVQTRDGSTRLNTTAVGSYAGDGLFTCRFQNETQTMVGFWNGTGFALTGASTFTTIGSAQSIWTAGTRVDMAMFQNLAFFGQGQQAYKYNGTEWTRHGIEQPNSGPTVVTAGAGNVPIGDVNYKVSYVNSYAVEGDVSAATTTHAVAASAIVTLTALPLAPTSFGVAARRIYRKDANTAGIYKRVTEIADNTTTTYVDNTASTALGASAPVDAGTPPAWKYVIAHKDRLFMVDPAEPSTVYYTELDNPFVVQAENFEPFNDGDGQIIRGLSVQGDSLVVHKDLTPWLLYMPSTDDTEWVKIKSNAKAGAVSHYAISDYGNGDGLQMYLGRNSHDKVTGFYALAGLATLPDNQRLDVAVVQSDSKSNGIDPDVFSLNNSVVSRACSIQFNNKLYYAVPYSSSTINNRIYQFDYARRAEDRQDGSWVPFTGISAAAFTIYNSRLYAQDANATGVVYRLEAGVYSDNGTAINSYNWTKEFEGNPGHEDFTKDFRFGVFIVETLGDWNMSFTYKTNSDRGSGTTKAINLNPGGSLWGSMIWGVNLWGGGVTRKQVTVYFGTAQGEKIQFKFDNQNTAGQAFKVLRGTIYYNLRGQRNAS
jgi:hypothetical protein